MIKKILALILCTAMLAAGLCACGETNGNSDTTSATAVAEGEKLSIIATIFPAYDFVRQIAGDLVDLKMLMKPGGEVHSYAPTADDMLAINNCDMLISIGGESDVDWVSDTIESTGNDKIVSFKLIDCVTAVEESDDNIAETEEEAEEGTQEEHEHEYDEHVWTSPKNVISIVAAISDKLCELDPIHGDTYRDNTHAYIEKLTVLDTQLKNVAQSAQFKTLVFADRFPFRYFCEEYGFEYFAAFNGCSASADPSAETISALISKVKELQLPVVFTIEFSTGATADTICEATGAKRVELHSCHNVSQEDFDNGITYVDLMGRNIINLKEALGTNVSD